jgi:2-oxoglutarate dehydrogenase complex dehydrogenase (E1) component-like enzyme
MHAGNKKQSETKKKQVQNVQKIGDSRIPGADKYAKCMCYCKAVGAQESQIETSGQRAWKKNKLETGSGHAPSLG